MTIKCVFCPAATWVGGAFIIGVAESVYDPTKGLIWALIPLQMSISFIIGKILLKMVFASRISKDTKYCKARKGIYSGSET